MVDVGNLDGFNASKLSIVNFTGRSYVHWGAELVVSQLLGGLAPVEEFCEKRSKEDKILFAKQGGVHLPAGMPREFDGNQFGLFWRNRSSAFFLLYANQGQKIKRITFLILWGSGIEGVEPWRGLASFTRPY